MSGASNVSHRAAAERGWVDSLGQRQLAYGGLCAILYEFPPKGRAKQNLDHGNQDLQREAGRDGLLVWGAI